MEPTLILLEVCLSIANTEKNHIFFNCSIGLFTIGGKKNLAIYNRAGNTFSSYVDFPDTNAVTELAISFDNSKLFVATTTAVRVWNGISWTM